LWEWDEGDGVTAVVDEGVCAFSGVVVEGELLGCEGSVGG
jgi:hypothetical protein